MDGRSLLFLNPCCDQVLFAVAVPTVVDRVIQQAIAQELTPLFEPQFSENSYGFRPGRGQHDALKAYQPQSSLHLPRIRPSSITFPIPYWILAAPL